MKCLQFHIAVLACILLVPGYCNGQDLKTRDCDNAENVYTAIDQTTFQCFPWVLEDGESDGETRRKRQAPGRKPGGGGLGDMAEGILDKMTDGMKDIWEDATDMAVELRKKAEEGLRRFRGESEEEKKKMEDKLKEMWGKVPEQTQLFMAEQWKMAMNGSKLTEFVKQAHMYLSKSCLSNISFEGVAFQDRIEAIVENGGDFGIIRNALRGIKKEDLTAEALKEVSESIEQLPGKSRGALARSIMNRFTDCGENKIANEDLTKEGFMDILVNLPMDPKEFLDDTVFLKLMEMLNEVEDPEKFKYCSMNRGLLVPLAKRLFSIKQQINTEDLFELVKPYLFGAPASVCESIPRELLISKLMDIGKMPFSCSNENQCGRQLRGKKDDDDDDLVFKPMGRPKKAGDDDDSDEKSGMAMNRTRPECQAPDLEGLKKFAKKYFGGQKTCAHALLKTLNTSSLTADQLEQLGGLKSCLDSSAVRSVASSGSVNCSSVSSLLEEGCLDPRTTSVIRRKCRPAGKNPQDYKKSDLLKLGSSLGLDFPSILRKIPKGEICDDEVLENIGKLSVVPDSVADTLVDKCLDGDQADDLKKIPKNLLKGLGLKQIGNMDASSLKGILDSVLESAEQGDGTDGRKRGVNFKIAKKLLDAGDMKEIIESEGLMKGIGVKDFLQSLKSGDIEANLGILEGKEAKLPKALRIAAMKALMEKDGSGYDVGDITPDKIRELKDLVKGMSPKDIEGMDKDDALAFVEALSEQTGYNPEQIYAIAELFIAGLKRERNEDNPLDGIDDDVLDTVSGEILAKLPPSNISKMAQSIGKKLLQKVGNAESSGQMNGKLRREFLEAFRKLSGKASGSNSPFSEEDIEMIGHLVTAMTSDEIKDQLPAGEVAKKALKFLGKRCLKKDVSTIVVDKIKDSDAYGPLSEMTEADVEELEDVVANLPKSDLDEIPDDKLARLCGGYIDQLEPSDSEEAEARVLKERDISDEDRNSCKDRVKAFKQRCQEAIVGTISVDPSRRRRRDASTWTCPDIKQMGEGITESSDEELKDILTAVLEECLPDLGSINGWSEAQRSLLLEKIEADLASDDICGLGELQLLSLNQLSLALTTDHIACLDLTSDDVASRLGGLSGWSTDQLNALANRFKSQRSISSGSDITKDHLSIMQHFVCGLSAAEIEAIPTAEFKSSTAVLGSLKTCPLAHLKAMKRRIIHTDINGPVSGWDVSVLADAGIIAAGIDDSEVKALSNETLNGLQSSALKHMPKEVLQAMSASQLESLDEVQVNAVSSTEGLSVAQRNALLIAEYGVNAELIKENEGTSGVPEVIASFSLVFVLLIAQFA